MSCEARRQIMSSSGVGFSPSYCSRCGNKHSQGAKFCTGCGMPAPTDSASAISTASLPAPEQQKCSVCKHLQSRSKCGSTQSPRYQETVTAADRCNLFELSLALLQVQKGLIDSLSGDRPSAAAAAFEAALEGGLPRDEEMETRFALSEQYRQLVFNADMGWQQCVNSDRFQAAVGNVAAALKIDREDGYTYFAEMLNRARLRNFDLMTTLAADSFIQNNDRRAAISYLRHKVGLCEYLPSCPLLHGLLKLATLYLDQRQIENAKICLRNIVDAEPVDRVDSK